MILPFRAGEFEWKYLLFFNCSICFTSLSFRDVSRVPTIDKGIYTPLTIVTDISTALTYSCRVLIDRPPN